MFLQDDKVDHKVSKVHKGRLYDGIAGYLAYIMLFVLYSTLFAVP